MELFKVEDNSGNIVKKNLTNIQAQKLVEQMELKYGGGFYQVATSGHSARYKAEKKYFSKTKKTKVMAYKKRKKSSSKRILSIRDYSKLSAKGKKKISSLAKKTTKRRKTSRRKRY